MATYSAPLTTPLRPSNRTGFTGISIHPQTKKLRADIRLNGQKTYLGLYPTVGAAAEARGQVLQKELTSVEKAYDRLAIDFDAVNQEVILLTKQLHEFQAMLQRPEVAQLLRHETHRQQLLAAVAHQ